MNSVDKSEEARASSMEKKFEDVDGDSGQQLPVASPIESSGHDADLWNTSEHNPRNWSLARKWTSAAIVGKPPTHETFHQ